MVPLKIMKFTLNRISMSQGEYNVQPDWDSNLGLFAY